MQKQNLIVVLLAVCATLLAVNLVHNWTQPKIVVGQAAAGGVGGGNFVMATGVGQGGNETLLYVLNTATQKLAAYSASKTRGVEFRGVRTLKYDFVADWMAPKGSKTTPSDVQKALKSIKR